MNLISENERFGLALPRVVLVDPAERHTWEGPGGEKIHYRRLAFSEAYRPGAKVIDGILDWSGFTLDGEEVPFSKDLAEKLPNLAEIAGLIRSSDPESPAEREGGSTLFYRRPSIGVINRLQAESMRRGEIDFNRFVPAMIGYSLVGWEGVFTVNGNPAEFSPTLRDQLPLEAVDALWEVILEVIRGETERWERELKNSMPASGD